MTNIIYLYKNISELKNSKSAYNLKDVYKKKQTLTLLIIFAFQLLTFGQQDTTINEENELIFKHSSVLYVDSVLLYHIKTTSVLNLELPNTNLNDTIISHVGYSLLYNEVHKQSNWIAYELTKEETNKLFNRTNKFISDPKVKGVTATNKDYRGFGYDRGHLAPAADMGWSLQSMTESFYYTNMSPQIPEFNRGIWKNLEELVRTWAIENNSVFVATGPVLTNNLPVIGENQVSVSNYFYKVILDYSEPSIKGIGFILPNTRLNEPLQNFAVSIDSIEKYTGFDFFYLLPDDHEEIIEKTLCINCWTWKSDKKTTTFTNKEHCSSNLCLIKENSKHGGQCQNNSINETGYCYLHENKNSKNNNNNDTTLTDQNTKKQTGTTKDGLPQYTGARGGIYHYSKNGKKVYDKK